MSRIPTRLTYWPLAEAPSRLRSLIPGLGSCVLDRVPNLPLRNLDRTEASPSDSVLAAELGRRNNCGVGLEEESITVASNSAERLHFPNGPASHRSLSMASRACDVEPSDSSLNCDCCRAACPSEEARRIDMDLDWVCKRVPVGGDRSMHPLP